MADHQKDIEALQRAQDDLNKRIFAMEALQKKQHEEIKETEKTHHEEVMKMLSPISKIFSNVNGFDKVVKWMLIRLGMIGAALGGLYLLIDELRKFFKTH